MGQKIRKKTLYQQNRSNDPAYMEPFERVANFCFEKHLNPHEVIDMIDEYTGDQYNCECYLLRDEKIKNLIQMSKKDKTHGQKND